MFLSLLPIEESLGLRGRRLNDTIAQQRTVSYAPDKFMRIDVKQSGGRLKVSIVDGLGVMVAGELRHATARVTNTGTTDISDIWLVLGDSGLAGSVWADVEQHAKSGQSRFHAEYFIGLIFSRSVDPSSSTTVIKSPNKLALPSPWHLSLEQLHSKSSISPGESFDIPLIVQAHAVQPFDLAALVVFRQVY